MVTACFRSRLLASLLVCGALASCADAAAETPQKPLWEFGLGIGAVAFADYRGADTSHVYPVPVPYFDYRGRIFRSDRDGLRGVLFNRELAEINISANATIPVRSSETTARSGMPNLKATVELGPSLDLHLWRSADRDVRLDLRMPARAALTIEATPRSIGWVFAPRLNLDLVDVRGHAGWNLGVLAGPLFADRRYHEYFYGVAPQYATADRPTYEARGGYSGCQALVSLSKRFPNFWVGAFVRHDWLGGAVFDTSPLVRSQSYWAGAVGISWLIGQSSRMVDPGDERP